MSWTLCIDFGTAFSKAAAAPSSSWSQFDPAQLRPLMVGGATGNAFLLDSAVFIDTDRILFGAAAVHRADLSEGSKRMALRSFKTLLSVSDLERALNTSAPRSIDPHGFFQMRDLIVLYLSFLLASIERAVASDSVLARVERFERRYAAPAWRGGDSAGNHDIVVRLFAEADCVRGLLGNALLSEQGVAIDSVRKALTVMGGQTLPDAAMSLIFEATAAAAYTSIGLGSSASHLIVVDMGAGTTDIAAIVRSRDGLAELPEARVTLKQAGDFVDRVIANKALAANPQLKTPEQQGELWRALMHSMRDIKESLFHEGRAVLRFQGRALTITMRDLERERDFKEFMTNLEEAYDQGFAVVCDAALAERKREIQAVAVGGGAFAPFVQQLIRKKPRSGKLRIVPRPATPEWAHAPEFGGNLAPVFPQLAIAIGGALAPGAMLARH